MISHSELGSRPFGRSKVLKSLIDRGEVQLAGNRKLKIYGTLTCRSGKRMKEENRVFFRSEAEALQMGYRPCGHCMNAAFKQWKEGSN